MDQSPGLPTPKSHPPPPVLGLCSLAHGFVSIFGWILFVLTAGVIRAGLTWSSNVSITIGLIAFFGMFLNLAAMLCGVVGAIRSHEKVIGIAGALLNALQIAGIIGLITFGSSVRQKDPRSHTNQRLQHVGQEEAAAVIHFDGVLP